MLRYALMAVAAATAIALVFVMLPTGGGQRPEPRILNSGDAVPSTSFVIHPAAPPAPNTPAVPATPPATAPVTPATAPTPPASSGDLDVVMQRLRSGGATPDAPASQPTNPAAAAPGTTPATASAATPPVPPPAPAAPAADAAAAPPPQWSSVTAQGTRWRMARSPNGFTISIDLGGGQVADVHVQPAFGNLDPASVNVRVDYLRDTITQNFAHQSASYTFARDGSVSIDH